jgi:hypothetical protein
MPLGWKLALAAVIVFLLWRIPYDATNSAAVLGLVAIVLLIAVPGPSRSE